MTLLDSEPSKGLLEKHLQTGFQLAIIGLCAWTVLTTQELSIETAKMGERVLSLQAQVTTLQTATANRYTDQDAERDRSSVYDQLRLIRDRLERLEGQ